MTSFESLNSLYNIFTVSRWLTIRVALSLPRGRPGAYRFCAAAITLRSLITEFQRRDLVAHTPGNKECVRGKEPVLGHEFVCGITQPRNWSAHHHDRRLINQPISYYMRSIWARIILWLPSAREICSPRKLIIGHSTNLSICKSKFNLRSLSYVDKRFNYIFTPFLYRKLILRTSKARTSFLQHVAPNRTLRDLVQCVWHEADQYDPKYEDFSQLSLILQAVPLITQASNLDRQIMALIIIVHER